MKRRFVTFEIDGHLAHFRCIYSNISSLSYHFPPRNTVAGIVSAVLGFDRERQNNSGYYPIFAREKCGIAVRIMNPVRKIQFTLNYLDTGSRGVVDRNKIRGRGPRKQSLVEYVVGDRSFNGVKYRIYITHEEKSILSSLEERLRNGRTVYPVSLGPAYCSAVLSLVENETGELPVYSPKTGHTYPVVTIMPLKQVELDLQEIEKQQINGRELKIILEENLPPDFGAGRSLLPSGGGNYVLEVSGKPVPVRILAGEIFQTEEGYGVFM